MHDFWFLFIHFPPFHSFAGKKKSLKHVVKKMEDLVKHHKTALKGIVNSTQEGYARHIERQQQQIETVDLANENENSRLSDCVIEEAAKKGEEDKNVDDVVMEEDKSEAERRLQEKLKLLQSSSDSEGGSETPAPLAPDTSVKTNGKIEEEPPDNAAEVIEIGDTPDKKDTPLDKAKRKIEFSFSDISNSDFESDKPNVDQLVQEVDEQVESEEDPKLKQVPKVELIRCDHLLKEGETTLLLSADSDMEEKLDKLVDSLCKFPRNRIRVPRVPKAKRRSGPFKSKGESEG